MDVSGVVWALIETLVRSGSAASLQFEFDFMRALIDSAILAGEGHFHLGLFGCAVRLIRRLAEMDSADVCGVAAERRTQVRTILAALIFDFGESEKF